MQVIDRPCGDFVNDSEERACKHLKSCIRLLPGNDNWYFISNLHFSPNNKTKPTEIDLIVLAKNGLHLIEIKHWGKKYIEKNYVTAGREVDKLYSKGQKIRSLLQEELNLNFTVYGKFLFTGEDTNSYRIAENGSFPVISGTEIYGLDDWKYLLNVDGKQRELNACQMTVIANLLMNRQLPKDGTFEEYDNLEKQSGGESRFRTIYKAKRGEEKISALLYVFDLTNANIAGEKAAIIAEREFKALHAIQTSSYAPRILETYQDASEYPGELYYFSVMNPDYPSLTNRMKEPWNSKDKLFSVIECFKALQSFHVAGEDSEKILHRNIKPENILIKPSGRPVFMGFIFSRIDGAKTILPHLSPQHFSKEYSAPELMKNASEKSDIYSLCKSLLTIFKASDDEISKNTVTLLEKGTHEDPAERPDVGSFLSELNALISDY